MVNPKSAGALALDILHQVSPETDFAHVYSVSDGRTMYLLVRQYHCQYQLLMLLSVASYVSPPGVEMRARCGSEVRGGFPRT